MRGLKFFHGAVVRMHVHGREGKLTRRLAETMPGIDGAGVQRLLRLVFRQGDVPAKVRARELVGVGSCKWRRRGKGARKKKTLPRSSTYRGGAVTGACEVW